MRKIFWGLIAVSLLFSACHRRNKPIQYVRVAVDSLNADDVEGMDTSWMDEPAIIIPEEMADGLENVIDEANQEYRSR